METVEIRIRVAAEELDKLRTKAEQLGGSFQVVGKTASDTSGHVRGFGAATDEAKRQVEGMAQRLGPMGSVLAKIGPAGLAAGVALGGLGLAMSKSIGISRDFEQSIADLSAITGATGRDLDFLSDAARRLGATTTKTAVEASTAFKLIASAKPELLEDAAALARVTEEALRLSEAAGLTLPQAASALTNSLNQFQASADEAGRFINVLAAGARLGAAEIPQLEAAITKSGTVAAQAGLSFEELNAVLQRLAQFGQPAEEFGTAFRNVLLILQKGAADTNPAIVGLSAALENLAAKSLSTADLVGLFGTRNVVVAKQLLETRDSIAGLAVELEGTNEAYRQAEIRTNTLIGDQAALDSATQELALTFGQVMLPGIRALTQGMTETVRNVTEVIQALGDLDDFVSNLVVQAVVVPVRIALTGGQEPGEDTIENDVARVAARLRQIVSESLLGGRDAENNRSFGTLGGGLANVAINDMAQAWDKFNDHLLEVNRTTIESADSFEQFGSSVQTFEGRLQDANAGVQFMSTNQGIAAEATQTLIGVTDLYGQSIADASLLNQESTDDLVKATAILKIQTDAMRDAAAAGLSRAEAAIAAKAAVELEQGTDADTVRIWKEQALAALAVGESLKANTTATTRHTAAKKDFLATLTEEATLTEAKRVAVERLVAQGADLRTIETELAVLSKQATDTTGQHADAIRRLVVAKREDEEATQRLLDVEAERVDLERESELLETHIRLLADVTAGTLDLAEAERLVADARALADTDEANRALQERILQQRRAIEETTAGIESAAERAETATFDLGASIVDIIDQVAVGLAQGTNNGLNALDILKNGGKALFADMLSGMLQDKLAFDLKIEKNFLRDIPSVIGQGLGLVSGLIGGVFGGGGDGGVVVPFGPTLAGGNLAPGPQPGRDQSFVGNLQSGFQLVNTIKSGLGALQLAGSFITNAALISNTVSGANLGVLGSLQAAGQLANAGITVSGSGTLVGAQVSQGALQGAGTVGGSLVSAAGVAGVVSAIVIVLQGVLSLLEDRETAGTQLSKAFESFLNDKGVLSDRQFSRTLGTETAKGFLPEVRERLGVPPGTGFGALGGGLLGPEFETDFSFAQRRTLAEYGSQVGLAADEMDRLVGLSVAFRGQFGGFGQESTRGLRPAVDLMASLADKGYTAAQTVELVRKGLRELGALPQVLDNLNDNFGESQRDVEAQRAEIRRRVDAGELPGGRFVFPSVVGSNDITNSNYRDALIALADANFEMALGADAVRVATGLLDERFTATTETIDVFAGQINVANLTIEEQERLLRDLGDQGVVTYQELADAIGDANAAAGLLEEGVQNAIANAFQSGANSADIFAQFKDDFQQALAGSIQGALATIAIDDIFRPEILAPVTESLRVAFEQFKLGEITESELHAAIQAAVREADVLIEKFRPFIDAIIAAGDVLERAFSEAGASAIDLATAAVRLAEAAEAFDLRLELQIRQLRGQPTADLAQKRLDDLQAEGAEIIRTFFEVPVYRSVEAAGIDPNEILGPKGYPDITPTGVVGTGTAGGNVGPGVVTPPGVSLDEQAAALDRLEQLTLDYLATRRAQIEQELADTVKVHQARIEGLQDEAEAIREAAQEAIKLRQEELELINEQLRVAQQWQAVLVNAQQTLLNLSTGADSPDDPLARLGTVQAAFAAQRAIFFDAGATDAARQAAAAQLNQLAPRILSLASAAGIPQGTEAFRAIFGDVTGALEAVAAEAAEHAVDLEALQRRQTELTEEIKDIQDTANERLEGIQDAIKAEQKAIEAAQDRATAQLEIVNGHVADVLDWIRVKGNEIFEKRQAEIREKLAEMGLTNVDIDLIQASSLLELREIVALLKANGATVFESDKDRAGQYGLRRGDQRALEKNLPTFGGIDDPTATSLASLTGVRNFDEVTRLRHENAQLNGIAALIFEMFPGVTGDIGGFINVAHALRQKIINPDVFQPILGFARGGLIGGPTVGLLGEAGRELVLPLDNPQTRQATQVFFADMARASNGGSAAPINVTVNVHVEGTIQHPEDLAPVITQAVRDAVARDPATRREVQTVARTTIAQAPRR